MGGKKRYILCLWSYIKFVGRSYIRNLTGINFDSWFQIVSNLELLSDVELSTSNLICSLHTVSSHNWSRKAIRSWSHSSSVLNPRRCAIWNASWAVSFASWYISNFAVKTLLKLILPGYCLSHPRVYVMFEAVISLFESKDQQKSQKYIWNNS